MPRPKRTKIKTTFPPLPGSSASTKPTAVDKISAAQQSSEKSSSDSDNIVLNAPATSRSRSVAQNASCSVSGALGAGDVRGAHKELYRNNPIIQSVKNDMKAVKQPGRTKQSASYGRSSLMTRSPLAEKTSAGNVRTLDATKANKQAKRLDTPGVRSKGKTEAGSRLLASAHSPPPNETIPRSSTVRDPRTNVVGRVTDSLSAAPTTLPTVPPSAAKVHGTPSFLSMANFKRRPRQGSLLQMVKQSIANESANEASEIEREDDPSLLTLGDSPVPSDDASQFRPDRTSNSRKRKASPVEHAARKVPRPSSNGSLGPASTEPNAINSSSSVEQGQPKKDFANQDEHQHKHSGSSSDIQKYVKPRMRDKHTSNQMSALGTPGHRSANLRSTLPIHESSPVNATSPISSRSASPVTSEAQKAKPRREAQRSAPQRVTTAALQELLPARRRRGLRGRDRKRQDEFEILESHSDSEDADREAECEANRDDDEDDELQKPSRRRKSASKSKVVTPGKRKTGKSSAKSGGRALGKTENSKVGAEKGSARTYGRLSKVGTGGKENEAGDEGEAEEDDSGPENAEVERSKELEDAAKKFQEVDDWDLDFESADIGAGRSSSPWR